MPPEDTSSLERLRRRLYQPNAASVDASRTLRQQPASFQPPVQQSPIEPKQGMSFAVKFLIIAAVFSVLAGIAAILLLFLGGRSVSPDQVMVTVSGPVTMASGDTVSLLIGVQNNNPTGITNTSLTVELPEGARNPDSVSEPLARYTDTLGDMAPGARAERTVRAAIYGTESQIITVPVRLEYSSVGSNATFVKEEEWTITITTSPVTMTVTSLKQTASGQPLTVVVAVRSNASETLNDIAVRGVYPFGFTQTTAEPTSTPGPLFRLGSLAPGEEKKITIQGVLVGQENDERVFQFTAGTAPSGSIDLVVPYSSKEAALTVTRPFLAVSLSVNRNETDNPVAAPGATVPVVVSWQNTLNTQISDAQILVTLSGEGIDFSSITTGNGFYRSSDRTVVFSSENSPMLSTVEPGASGSGTFNFRTKSATALSGVRNPTVNMNVSVSGRRTGEAGVPQSVTSSMTRTLKVATDAVLSSRMVKSTGPFTNPGPWPPEPNVETMYTVILTLENSLNSIADGAVTMTLPSYVRYTGAASPSDGSLAYDAETRRVVWRVGDIQPGGGTKQMAFQIAFLPSTSQSGSNAILVSDQVFSGTDRFTGQAVSARVNALDIRVTSDPAYKPEYGMVKN